MTPAIVVLQAKSRLHLQRLVAPAVEACLFGKRSDSHWRGAIPATSVPTISRVCSVREIVLYESFVPSYQRVGMRNVSNMGEGDSMSVGKKVVEPKSPFLV